MSDARITLLRLSVSLVTFAVKGSQDGIVQQQIEVMGLRRWLSLVAAWIAQRVYTEAARLRDLIELKPSVLDLKQIAVPTPNYLF
jgi:hypothetical protein